MQIDFPMSKINRYKLISIEKYLNKIDYKLENFKEIQETIIIGKKTSDNCIEISVWVHNTQQY